MHGMLGGNELVRGLWWHCGAFSAVGEVQMPVSFLNMHKSGVCEYTNDAERPLVLCEGSDASG